MAWSFKLKCSALQNILVARSNVGPRSIFKFMLLDMGSRRMRDESTHQMAEQEWFVLASDALQNWRHLGVLQHDHHLTRVGVHSGAEPPGLQCRAN